MRRPSAPAARAGRRCGRPPAPSRPRTRGTRPPSPPLTWGLISSACSTRCGSNGKAATGAVTMGSSPSRWPKSRRASTPISAAMCWPIRPTRKASRPCAMTSSSPRWCGPCRSWQTGWRDWKVGNGGIFPSPLQGEGGSRVSARRVRGSARSTTSGALRGTNLSSAPPGHLLPQGEKESGPRP